MSPATTEALVDHYATCVTDINPPRTIEAPYLHKFTIILEALVSQASMPPSFRSKPHLRTTSCSTDNHGCPTSSSNSNIPPPYAFADRTQSRPHSRTYLVSTTVISATQKLRRRLHPQSCSDLAKASSLTWLSCNDQGKRSQKERKAKKLAKEFGPNRSRRETKKWGQRIGLD